ncbi:CBS domain-containing protein [Rubrolithibacter danxiaensis]|uniref:CBS domain-containing protein n=1 Tax=Rubrolithibacter danxiaensis TaxID=3390805 RepID=UPI003BF84141
MKTVSHILSQKPAQLFSVTTDTSVYHALEIMMEKNISALLVMDFKKLLGIFSERDYARKIILQGKSSKDTPIDEVMTSNLITVSMNDSIEYCMQLMTENHIRHLPVVENEKVSGMISIGDVVKSVIEDQKSIIEHLQNYISG